MSYQVLARKYRPKSFATLVGQEHVVRALTHALDHQRLHHAYLFTGTRGVGKTTLSRILAKSFNCETGITSQACGVCDACVAIDAGRFVDYIEMDAASNRGVDEMAQLLEQAVYAPSNARFKVYMIDEVHMLTNHAFNAMLKTLEEPPPHVKFILATTDPQKIPPTVLSRCLQFNLKQMPPGHIISHLENILGQEHITFEQPALRLLAQGAQGSMRDALSLTDQAIAYAAGKVTLDAVQGMLGALNQSYLIRLLDALAEKNGAALLDVADEMNSRSLSYKSALQDLGSLLHQIAIAQLVPAALADDLPERGEILRLAQLLDREEVQLYYQIAVHGRNELGLAPDEYAGFSMSLLRMLAFRPGTPDSNVGNAQPPGAAVKVKAMPLQVASPQSSRVTAPLPEKLLPAAPVVVTAAAVEVSAAIETSAMSPRMAALAAARAGSSKQGAAKPAPTPAVMPATPVTPAAPVPALPVKSVAPAKVAAPSAPAPWEDDNAVPEMPAGFDDQFPDQWDQAAVAAPASPVAAVNAATADIPVSAPIAKPPAALAAPAEMRSVPELNWDGHWPNLAASLPMRGVAQQLAQQSELVRCEVQHDVVLLNLRVPLETLLSSGSLDKLTAALSEHFQRKVRVEAEIGAVAQTANAQAIAERAVRQEQAEKAIHADSFVQTLVREFGAAIVTGSIKPV